MTFEKKEFEKYIKCTQLKLKSLLTEELRRNGYEPINKKGFLYAEGIFPVLLCAHMDTVHICQPNTIIYKNDYMESPEGIGGDDRCGIYIIMQLIKYYHCSVLFLEDEEIGGVGASEFVIRGFRKSARHNKYIMEFDRRGGRDAVFYDCDNKQFEQFITQSGYFHTEYGSFSDISILAPSLGLAAVNLSAGYYKEHTACEYVNIREMIFIISEAKKILANTDGKYAYVKRKYYQYNKHYLYNFKGEWDETGKGY